VGFPTLQPDDGGARLRDRSRCGREGLVARRDRETAERAVSDEMIEPYTKNIAHRLVNRPTDKGKNKSMKNVRVSAILMSAPVPHEERHRTKRLSTA
jgi:hypothetical protein